MHYACPCVRSHQNHSMRCLNVQGRDPSCRPSTRDTTQSAVLSGLWDAQGARKIDFGAFESALPLLAEQKGVSAEEVRRCIVLSEGPRRNNSVTPDFVRLHDDKTTFTGASLLLDTDPPLDLFSRVAGPCLDLRTGTPSQSSWLAT